MAMTASCFYLEISKTAVQRLWLSQDSRLLIGKVYELTSGSSYGRIAGKLHPKASAFECLLYTETMFARPEIEGIIGANTSCMSSPKGPPAHRRAGAHSTGPCLLLRR